MAPGPLLFSANQGRVVMAKSKRVSSKTNIACLKKGTDRFKKLGKRASKTIAVKG
jgi:hypothetical protein